MIDATSGAEDKRLDDKNGKVESGQVHRALDILEYLARSGTPKGLTEIAAHVDCPKSTIHRLLATLGSRGYVTQHERSMAYSAGIRCFELGSLWAQSFDLRHIALPHLRRLNEATGETTHLAVYDEGDTVYIEKLESSHPVVARSHVGRRCPSAYVATGRALLAYQPTHEIEAQLANPLPRHTPDSLVEPAQVEAMLADVRANGYAVNHGGFRVGVGGVAAPVRDHTGRVVASVGLCLPEQRFGADRFDELRDRTVEAAVAITVDLGGPRELVTAPPVPA
ncbi:MAG: IclR family transcriptional regulator [Micromonosporaceae bacterium]